MFSLTKHIEYLLANHDCVVVPGLGAFLGVRVPSFYDEETETFYPPYRRFAFNGDLKESDGMLINSVKKAEGLEYRQATETVRKSVEEILLLLAEEGEVSIGKIGRLEKASETSISFVPFERDQLSPLMSCLPSFYVKQAGTLEFHKDLHKKAKAKNISDNRIRGSRIGRFVRNTIGAAAAIFIGLTISTPVQISNTHEASLGLPKIKKTEVIIPSVNTSMADSLLITDQVSNENESLVASSQPISEVQEKTGISQNEIKPMKPEKSEAWPTVRFNDSDAYLVVVGSLTSKEDAEEFILNNKRKSGMPNFGIQDQDGKYRVYVATSDNIGQARKLAQSPMITHKFKGAWVTYRY